MSLKLKVIAGISLCYSMTSVAGPGCQSEKEKYEQAYTEQNLAYSIYLTMPTSQHYNDYVQASNNAATASAIYTMCMREQADFLPG